MKYFNKSEASQFSYIKIPKMMFSEALFSGLSTDSKLLYGLLLEKMSMSLENNWLDEEGAVYIIYPMNEIQEDLGVSMRKAIDIMGELDEIGLIERVRQGRGIPNRIYVKNFARPDIDVQKLHMSTT